LDGLATVVEVSELMTWLELSVEVLGSVLGAFGDFAAGVGDITTVGEDYTKV
jgi:hypothetical protein